MCASTYLAIESWVKRSQKPKTGLASTSRIAYATISALTSMLRDPSAIPQMLAQISSSSVTLGAVASHIHWVDCPKDKSETSNSTEEGGSASILSHDNTAAIEAELVNDDQVGDASHSVPSPFRSLFDGKGGEKASQDHDDISDEGHEDVGTIKTSQ